MDLPAVDADHDAVRPFHADEVVAVAERDRRAPRVVDGHPAVRRAVGIAAEHEVVARSDDV
jgi:hypothetical protein